MTVIRFPFPRPADLNEVARDLDVLDGLSLGGGTTPHLGLITPGVFLSSASLTALGALNWHPIYTTSPVGVDSIPVMGYVDTTTFRFKIHLGNIAWTSDGATVVVDDFVVIVQDMTGAASMTLQTNSGPYSITSPLSGSPFGLTAAEWSVTENIGAVFSYDAVTANITVAADQQVMCRLQAAAHL